MKVRSKIIGLLGFMIFIVSCLLVLFMFFSISGMRSTGSSMFDVLDQNAHASVSEELRNLADNIGNYVLVLESEIDRNMLNAAMVLYEDDRLSGGTLTLENLERIKQVTGMSDLYLGDMDGVFTLSTEPEAIGISLFDIWDGYRMLVTGEADYLPSDLKVKAETGEIFKFTAIARADNRGILESALDAGAIEVYLHRFIDNNESIRSMNLFDIDQMTLTCNHAEGAQPIYTKGQTVPPGTTEIGAFFSGRSDMLVEMDKQNARIYFPIYDGSRVRYVLFIDLDTASYFTTQNLIEASISELVRESTFFSALSLGTVFATLLIFTAFVSFMINKLVKRVEEAMDSAKIANQSKSIFLSNMSHEIRTPMNAIIGMTSIGMTADDEDRMKDCFSKIDNASKHLLGIINNILDMSKIEAGKFDLSESEFDFMKMIEQVVTVNRLRIEEKNQNFSVDIDSAIPQYLFGDDQRLSQVIINLINNAVKFTAEGGSIKLDARLAGEERDACKIEVSVTDSGIGISSEQQAKLFNSFQQAENTISRRFGGTGLGLAISKSVVEMMGGEIWVESELGKGATFSFTVLVKRGAGEHTAGDAEERALDRFDGHCILLAEDIDINREIVVSLLEPTLLEIECAENGREALDMFIAAPYKYELIFMDLQMPEMDGLEATRRIRALDVPNAKTIPIIAMTANAFREDIIECLEAGMNGHLRKPLDFDAVLTKLRTYLMADVPGGLIWDRKYELGNSQIDRQHKSLFDVVNSLIKQCEQGKATDILHETIIFLADYTTYHFDSEEALQIKVGYPGYKDHKKIHDDFRLTVGKLMQKYDENGSSEQLVTDIRDIVVNWLINHIQGEDTELIRFTHKHSECE